MLWLLVLALFGAVVKLWTDIGALRLRVRAMELGQPTRLSDFPPNWATPAVHVPAEPVEPDAVVAPLVTVRVVQPPRHPGDEELPTPRHPRESGDPAPAIEAAPANEMTPRVRGDDGTRATPPTPAAPRPAFSFEDLFGRKLPIWAGGITLAVCGFLIVKYSIDAGLLSPWVRVVGGLLFGSGLIAGAEAARQNEHRVRDPRVAQALSGAGVATLYAAILIATNLYHLIPPLTAFVGLAGVTVLAGFLSIRFGAPSAVLGLVGGLAAPALVGSGNPNVPLLAAYLSLAVGGLATLGRAQRWWWLGVAALAGGFGWGLVLILGGALDLTDRLSVGGFLLLLGVGLPVLLFGGARGHLVRLVGTLAAAAQLAALVATGGYAMLEWSLFGLLGIASVWLSRREKPLADLPAPALVVALLLMMAWPLPTEQDLAIVLAGAAAIFGLPAAWRVWRPDARLADAGAVAALAAAPIALWLLHVDPSDRDATLLALLGAAVAGGVAALGWRNATRREDIRFVLLTATAATLTATAAAFALPEMWIAPAWAAVAAGLVLLADRAQDRHVERFAWLAGAATLGLYVLTAGRADPLGHAGGLFDRAALPLESLRWAIATATALVFARWGKLPAARPIGEVAAVLLGYIAVAQLLPTALLPLIPAVGLAALGWFRRSDAATITVGVLATAWAAWPLGQWLAGDGGALLGFPLYVDALPSLTDTATRLLAPAVAAALLLWRHPPVDRTVRLGWTVGLALLGTPVAHIAYKQLFALHGAADFVAHGLAERTLWEALLALAAVGLAKRVPVAARALGIAAMAHLGWFTLVIHDPLWSDQAVGALPVVNLLLPVYALAFGLLWAAGRTGLPPHAERARGWAQMLLVLLFAASALRQLFQGSLLATHGVGEGEDILRSVVAIGIAIGFLQWGIRRRSRDWRIASLVVMLGAVAKVFLLDTSGLHGLLRIASFAALGFSLIGIGWLYSRYLPDDRSPAEAGAQDPEHNT